MPVDLRLATFNVWGVSVKDPMTRPKRSCEFLLDLGQNEGWWEGEVPIVVGLQEVYAFRLDWISWGLVHGLRAIEGGVNLLRGWLPKRVINGLLFANSFVMHFIIILVNSMLFYPVNFIKCKLFTTVFDVKKSIVEPIIQSYATGGIHGFGGSTFCTVNLNKSGDSGLVTFCSGKGLAIVPEHAGFRGFRTATGSEILCNKGLLWTVFETEKICVINTHMQALDDPFRHFLGDKGAYKKQVEDIHALITHLASQFTIDFLFLLGDLNTMDFTSTEVEHTFKLHQLNDHHVTHVDGAVDHILCNVKIPKENLRCRHIKGPSDHKMVVLELSDLDSIRTLVKEMQS
eukprot:TRINITY_DN10645_c0_g1_i1.p1 TRINITY_DN10645_c0_g1~~TRINITY_DN10645_c0_g1_i1.p1  ORF type:complete len:351 (+),score=54.48 TRINITY_DN10645_c0_g1_i1:22-1053(+)